MKRIEDMTFDIVKRVDEEYDNVLLKSREIKKTAYLIITSDRGLAGAYNSSLFKALSAKLKEHSSKDEYICGAIGKQGFNFLKRINAPLMQEDVTYVRDDVMFLDVAPLAKKFIDAYKDGEIDKLVIIYNHFVNSLTQEVTFEELLPIKKSEAQEESKNIDYIYETGINKTLDLLLPMYVQDIIYGVILDAKTAEHSARMNSMKSATDNAMEVIEKLQLLYNRARQNVVTNELIDIIGGANAIGGK